MDGTPPKTVDLPLPKRPLCDATGCRTPMVDPWIAAAIAFVTATFVIYYRVSELENSYGQLEQQARQSGPLASPFFHLSVLRDKFPYFEWFVLLALAVGATVVHGMLMRHKKYLSVIFGAAGVPGALIAVMVMLRPIIFPITGGH